MLSNNNMLTLGGNQRQRQRGTVRVSEPSYGFFIAGSSIEGMNGVYVRRNIPRVRKENTPDIALYYEHEEGLWHMCLNVLPEEEQEEESEDEYEYMYYYRQKPRKKRKTHEWVFTDEFGKSRFRHDGDTIVPGAGVRWKHVHPKPKPVESPKKKKPAKKASAARDRDYLDEDDDDDFEDDEEDEDEDDEEEDDEEEEEEEPGPATSTAVATIKEDDEEELPWQVIAILDLDMVQQLLWSSEHRKKKVRDAKAGKTASPPARASLEAAYAPGRWLFRVTATEGAILRIAPDDIGAEVGRRERGEYVRGIKLSADGEWLRLDASEDLAMASGRTGRSRMDQFYNAEYSRRQVWVRICESGAMGTVYLTEVPPEETAVLDLKGVGDAEESFGVTAGASGSDASAGLRAVEAGGGVGMTGDLFDKPFVPRMEDGESSSDSSLMVYDLNAGVIDPALEGIREAAESSQLIEIPIGATVEISGLKARSGIPYNGVTGVVVTGLDSGRQGVRLDTPFSGKILSCKPDKLVFSNSELEEGSSKLSRAARLLGIQLSQIGLAEGSESDAAAWGFAGENPTDRLGCALRAALRDLGGDISASNNSIRDAAELLLTAIQENGEIQSSPKPADLACKGRSPEAFIRSGALGSRAAAAIVSAYSPICSEERDAGLQALRLLLKQESVRAKAADCSVMVGWGEDSDGGDELLLRLGLVQALLEGRRESEALAEARFALGFYAVRFGQTAADVCSPLMILLGRCQLRLGMRAEGITALERVESIAPQSGFIRPKWLSPVSLWGHQEAARLMVAHKAAERCRLAAVDTYARGSFEDAAMLYGRSLALLQAGFSDDKRGRAAALADRAGCLRRARKLDEAVAELDAALNLFPRYARAIFRRAACLLEAGKASAAVEGFKDLYRVDRDWPNLSEWLVRAFSLQKRQTKSGFKGQGVDYDDIDSSSPRSNGGASPSTPSSGKLSDADMIAREVDHYAVLGVSTDATEKQLKTAYRMRSLQFHPDRRQGNTAAFQRISQAYEILSDPDKRQAYDEGGDIKVKRGKRDDDDDSEDSEPEEEEHKTTMREEVEREFYPERYHFWPFGDPFVYKRKHMAQKKAKEPKPAWQQDDWN